MRTPAPLLLVLCTFAGPLFGDEPTYFRDRSGQAVGEQRLPDNFDDGAVQIWRTPLDGGISSPCVHGDWVFVTTYKPEPPELATIAIQRRSGRIAWRRQAPVDKLEQFHQVGSPASASPACDGERVYVFFGSSGLLCYDLKGNLLWRQAMGPFQDEFGASSSPVLVDDLVVINEDHDLDSFLAAYDKRTGEPAWRVSREGFTRSYSTPVVWRQEGSTQLIVAGSLQLTAYDAKDGKKLWWVDGLSRLVDSTPVLLDNKLYFASWTPGGDEGERIELEAFADALRQYDKNQDGKIGKDEVTEGPVPDRFFRIDLDQDEKLDQAEWERHARVFSLAQNVAMAIRPGGEGDRTKEAIEWVHRKGLPTVPSSIVRDGVMYMVKDGGIITSLDAKTGEPLKQGRAAGPGNYYASLVAGDGKVFLCSERGVVTVLQAGREWEILSSHDFEERIMATPSLVNGIVYLRTDKALYCYARNPLK